MKFFIVSYNILQDDLANPDFINSSKYHLNFDYRNKLLIDKIEKVFSNNTIYCFQEVGNLQLASLQKYFNSKNFYCVYIGDVAIFFSFLKFSINYIDLGKFSNLIDILTPSKKIKYSKILYSKSKYYIILTLKSKLNNIEFTISNSHFVSSEEFKDLKFLGGYVLFKKLERFNNVIFCGDMNSLPDSYIIQLIQNGESKNNLGNFKLKKKYKSVYDLNSNLITTHTSNKYTPIFSEMIDYIFIDNKIKSSKVIQIPKKESVSNVFLPNKNEPSDHFMIGCLLQID